MTNATLTLLSVSRKVKYYFRNFGDKGSDSD